jgi:GNAT superfamily N-acetyltransferase
MERALRVADGLPFVWEESDAILRFSSAHGVGFLAYLSLLVVKESVRRKGIGKMLIQHREDDPIIGHDHPGCCARSVPDA